MARTDIALAKLPTAIALGRASGRVVTQNLVIALGVIALLAPVAAVGFAPLSVAVIFHEGSTIVVVLNALRLLAWRDRKPATLVDARTPAPPHPRRRS